MIWMVIFFIAMISLLAVYTSSGAPALRSKASTEGILFKHALLLGMGFVVMYLIHRWDYRLFARLSDFLLYLTIPVLVYTMFFGQEINDASRWITVFGQSFQPSDLAKVALMVYLAKMLTLKQDVIKDFQKGFLPIIAWVVLICMLIGKDDLSTAAVIFFTSVVLMFIGGVNLRHLGSLIAIGAIALVILFKISDRSSTWMSRWDNYVESLVGTDYEPSYQMEQAYAAMASGGFFGKGVGKSTQRNFLPNSTSDMIYPVIIEEHGFLGGLVVLTLYMLLLWRAVAIVTVSKTFGALLAAGLSFMLVIQALFNMAVSVGLLPVTGLPLPMLSMGGTSILFTALALGIILSVSRTAIEERKASAKGGALQSA